MILSFLFWTNFYRTVPLKERRKVGQTCGVGDKVQVSV